MTCLARIGLLLATVLLLAVLDVPDAPIVPDTPNVLTVPAIVTSPETFAVCKVVDVGSTYYALSHGLATEGNPLVASLLGHGWLPLIALSIGIYFLLKHYNDPMTTGMANAVTCGVAVHNLLLIP